MRDNSKISFLKINLSIKKALKFSGFLLIAFLLFSGGNVLAKDINVGTTGDRILLNGATNLGNSLGKKVYYSVTSVPNGTGSPQNVYLGRLKNGVTTLTIYADGCNMSNGVEFKIFRGWGVSTPPIILSREGGLSGNIVSLHHQGIAGDYSSSDIFAIIGSQCVGSGNPIYLSAESTGPFSDGWTQPVVAAPTLNDSNKLSVGLSTDTSLNSGIGAPNLGYKLAVGGSLRWAGNGSSAPYAYSNTDASGLYMEYVGTTAANSILRLQSSPSGAQTSYAQVNINPVNGFSFMSTAGGNSGNVGIGMTAPAYKLDVNGVGNFNGYAIHNVATPSADTDAATQGYVKSSISPANLWSGTKNVTIWNGDSGSGNVGIGVSTVNASNKLNLVGGGLYIAASDGHADASLHITTSYGGFDRLTQVAPTGVSKPGLNLMGSTDAASANHWWVWGPTSEDVWRIQSGTGFSGSAGLSIDNNGDIGIGTTNPITKLDVKGKTQIDTSGTYSAVYSWAGGALQTNSLEIMDRYNGSTGDGVYPTLTFHDYGNGGAQFSMEGLTTTLHLGSGQSNSAGTLAGAGGYFSKLKIWGALETTGAINVGGSKINNLGVPVVASDAVTKGYVDSIAVSNAGTLQFLQSNRDFPSGTLIESNIDYSQANGDPFLLEIEGNSYGNVIPIDIKVQGYIYSNTIINISGISNGTNISGLVAMNYNGKLCFWFPTQGYWNGYSVFINSSYGGVKTNRVTAITNTGKPAGTKEVAITVYQSIHSGNIASQSVASAGNSNTVAGLAVHAGRNNEANKIVRTDVSGYLQTGYINSSSGDESNNSNPTKVWGTNGSDSYLRTYYTSALSVNYAASAGNADTTDGQHLGTGNNPTFNRLTLRQGGVALGSGNSSQLEINNAGSGAANISFHREGQYGAHFGLDTDNWFSTYGWSAGGGYTGMRVGPLSASGAVNAPTLDASGYVYGAELYTRDNVYLGYMGNWLSNLLNQNVRTDASPTFANVYINGWLYNSGRLGIYNSTQGTHFYADSPSYWKMSSNNGMQFNTTSAYDSPLAGYVYHDGSGFGMLNNQGNWMFYAPPNSTNVIFPGTITASSYVYSSDQNLKKNIATIQNPLEKILQLRGVSFDWKKDNTPSVGLIAQEVEKVFPELVVGEEGKKGVQYGNLVAPLIEAVKEQQKEISGQDEKINNLNNVISNLNARLKTLENKNKK